MTELKPRIHDECNGLDYVLVGDYYVPDLKLPEEHRPIGMWGRLHRTYLEQYRPTRFSALCLSGELHVFEMKKVFVLICICFYVVIALTNKEKYIFLLVI